jgi:hypothetical protein
MFCHSPLEESHAQEHDYDSDPETPFSKPIEPYYEQADYEAD